MIELENVTIKYGSVIVIKDLSLTIDRKEFFTLLGSSGCGKTTLLRAIAGFVKPSSGRIVIDGKDVTSIGPEERDVGIVFQNYALFPHMTVFENVAFGLRVARKSRSEIASEVNAILERVGIFEHTQKKPSELSGGQQQRVAIARALVLGAQVILLDEPLSNLDAKMRETMRSEIRSIQQRFGLTAVYVTHDQQEALVLSDRVAVLFDGAIEQLGTPRQIYHQPATQNIYRFVGECTELTAETLKELGEDQLLSSAGEGSLFTRPEDFILGAQQGSEWLVLNARLTRSEFRGSSLRLTLEVGDSTIHCDAHGRHQAPEIGTEQPVSIRRSNIVSYGDSP
ncbi:MAG: ABC transporter ATP-binding protein [Pseudomonadota bacterium]